MAGNSILVINAAGAETRVALVENGTIHEYYLERKREKGQHQDEATCAFHSRRSPTRSATSPTGIDSITPGAGNRLTTRSSCPQGPLRAGSVGP